MIVTLVLTPKAWVQVFAGEPVKHPTKGWILKNRVFPLDPLRVAVMELAPLLELDKPRRFRISPFGASRWELHGLENGDVQMTVDGRVCLEMCDRLGGLLDIEPGQRMSFVPLEDAQ